MCEEYNMCILGEVRWDNNFFKKKLRKIAMMNNHIISTFDCTTYCAFLLFLTPMY